MRRFLQRVRFIFNVRKFIPFLFRFFASKEVSMQKKLLSCLLLIGYIVFPFDLIPDFFVFFGMLDDVAVFMFVLQQMVKMAPPQLKEQYGIQG
ncbi:YkvA family protein [Aneurinibacillus aneurinilyticus]|jgi:uncharacterized membrane protein YkvA (DUF1232 family)|uniref:DUF1232 domain-containing protein n=2 Tax=Aneurinibacillus aneurinilyticus TaxID=1391 RepID=A0A848CPT6_ANEAE|nr:DUF1232 domain-containing protein [Aneurinibacillus aneurinilyticus]ERI07898.1 hypothetical protein HMPREF0083_04013 [Aneurinibacillus aneurinilyticus ATCC 12856]MCI1696511.1 DUF1232 domain-containing protein [Aneurinibacillus aneurinilyticus]MED0671661.1 DUF1232 domain-containing protein [Aneurinibacillus aneurinilyticus]MED0709501.1 DUF1232 domain-containing protein [Aneurinibacillus aneurinilyticus]MED0726363.1 DUF1232 domain-containing protein [Aneurinibacillus aneurinilyticus]